MRKYPLFIIDTSRLHARGMEIDYLQCTAHDCPFVAEVSIVTDVEYRQLKPLQLKQIFSDPNGGLRIRVLITDIDESADQSRTRTLLKKALKEVLERRKTKEVDINNITHADITKWASLMINSINEEIANGNNDPLLIMQRQMFAFIYEKFTDK